ncbi:digestive cysteine proteinase 2-like [Diadema antillarum]|uniref:digestive cysteine proteinase 2-like n=1 Tax=Diadema antillarum TaxID=105358 RepID=UPI003A8A52E3
MIVKAGHLLLIGVLTGLTCVQAAPNKPVFKDAYHATGFIRLPYAELDEPFEIFYQGKNKRSRIDVYNGMDKTFYRGDEPSYGNTYKISPATISNNKWQETCFNVTGDKTNPVLPQSLLPDLTFFTYSRTELRNGLMVDLWQNVTATTFSNLTRKSVYTFAVTRSAPVRPVRYEMMGYNTLLGSHFDKYVIDYEFFDETSAIPNTTFDIPKGLKCRGFPGPGMEHQIKVNPFREMINPEMGDRYHHLFNEFKDQFGKRYETTQEHETRKGHFTKNVRMIHSMNRANRGFTLAINHLADLAEDEFRKMRGRQRSSGSNHGIPFDGSRIKLEDVPDSIDWNILGAVSPVKDQAICGSCWSFGAAEAIEGGYFVKNKERIRVSQQMLMDCTWAMGNNGCDGGEEWRAYEWLKKNKVGFEAEEDYGPYLGQDGECHYDKSKGITTLSRYVNVTSGNQGDVKKAISTRGPISVGIDAHLPSFAFYSYGVYYDAKCGNTSNDLDHAVLAVGYGTYNGQDYWLIKNSWSTYWGNNGYVMISMKDNNCGVAMDATYPCFGFLDCFPIL